MYTIIPLICYKNQKLKCDISIPYLDKKKNSENVVIPLSPKKGLYVWRCPLRDVSHVFLMINK